MVKGPARNAQFFFATEHVMKKYGFKSFMDSLATTRDLWKRMSDEEKAPWKLKEQQWKAYMRGPAGDKYRKDSSGNNLQAEFDRSREREQFESHIREVAENYVVRGNIEQPYFFMSFEYALVDDLKKYYPCEVAIVKYSLKRGIEDRRHYFLKPGEYPLGSKGAAKKHSEERHKIPWNDFEKATDGYSAVFADIRDVLLSGNAGKEASGGYPPIYCMPQDVETVRNCLEVLFDRAMRHESERPKVVASAVYLVIQLFGSDVCGEAKALEILNTSAFDFAQGVACDFHYEIECINCALATARKIGFALSDSLKTTYNLTMTPHHLPNVSQMTFSDDVNFVAFETGKKKKPSYACSSASKISDFDRDDNSDVSSFSFRGPRGGYDDKASVTYSASGRQYDDDSLVSGFSGMGIGRGHPLVASSSVSSLPSGGFQSYHIENNYKDSFDDDNWTTVSSNQMKSCWRDDGWGDSSGKPTTQTHVSSRPLQPAAYQPTYNYENRHVDVDDDDWGDEWESMSITSSTARPLKTENQHQTSSASPYQSLQSSITTGGVGRGRGLYKN